MKASLAELVNVILQHIEEQPEAPISAKRMRVFLSKQGYSKRDIDAAMALVEPRLTHPPRHTVQSPASVRHLSPYEACKLTVEARDALVRLEMYELIDLYEREMLLERMGQMEGEIGMDDLDYLLSWVLYSNRDVESQQTIYSVFEGNSSALN